MPRLFSAEVLEHVFDRTDGRCHICYRRVAWKNYGILGARGAWEVDHSVPRAYGGTDRLTNLLPAHIRCNRSKQAGSSRSARGQHGRRRAPYSASGRQAVRVRNGALGAGLGWLAAAILLPQARVAAAIIGALGGASIDPDA
jgi:hypothetical protein